MIRALPFALLVLVACGERSRGAPAAPDAAAGPVACNPLASEGDCLLPFPSDVFLVDDPAQPSGKRVAIPEAAAVRTREGTTVDLLRAYPADGFSHLPPLLALFPGGLDPAGLVPVDAPERSLEPAATTVILEAATGRRVLHFAEVDPEAGRDGRRALLLRPMERLANGARYVVGIAGLVDRAGAPVPAPEPFRRLRDREPGAPPALGRYDADVFPVLAQAGLAREALLLAWDFTVQSEASVTGDLLAVRADALGRLAAGPPAVTLGKVERDVAAHVAVRVEGTVRVPLYVDSVEPGARLRRGAGGAVEPSGEAEVPFLLIVPPSALAAAPVRLVQFGHGFFGSRREIDGFIADMADRIGVCVISTDWWGMSEPDILSVARLIVDRTDEVLTFTDRVHQAMANQLFVAAARGALAAALEREHGLPRLWEPAPLYFYGISEGHVLGGTYAALSPELERVALGAGGGAFSFMMSRARPFGAFLTTLVPLVPDALELQKFIALTQTTLDRIDPVTYAPHVLADTYPGSPAARRVLIQTGLGDTQVPHLAARIHARALGVGLIQPAARPIFGLELVIPPADASALVEFDFHHPDPLPGTDAVIPFEDNGVHEAVRRLPAAIRQLDAFWRPAGRVEQTCDGACDPE